VTQNSLEHSNVTLPQLIGLVSLAYAFSFLLRMIWVWQFQDASSFYWNDELMINTNDGYFFASGVQNSLLGLHESNPRIPDIWRHGVVFFSTVLVKFTPMSLETTILYMPAIISSLVVIPIILIARLYKQTLWGFFAALLGSIAWSYYNRTMIGYYDTDMFSAMAPMFILFFLMKSTVDFNLRSALYAAIAIVIYPFLYDQGRAVVYAMGIMYALYMLIYHRQEKTTYKSLILIFFALIPSSLLGVNSPYNYIFSMILILVAYIFLNKTSSLNLKTLMVVSGIVFITFLFSGNVFGLIYAKVTGYLSTGTAKDGLHFYSVVQTVREAGKIPFEVFANRISGSVLGVFIALIGYIFLVIKHRAFILALPLVGIGVFALWGGLRFTVYVVPIAAMSAIFLFVFLAEQFIKEKVVKYLFIFILTIGMLYPNITHIIDYKVPTVMNKSEVQDLAKLNEISDDKDYTLSWWDYGYPIWYYSRTNTLIDGGKHNHDNFIISKIMFTNSQEQVANLSRLAVETYVDSNYKVVANELFTVKENPKKLLNALKSSNYQLPTKTRDVYLYMPYRMMRIFPTVGVFGNLNLMTGKKERNIAFYPTRVSNQSGSKLFFANGIIFDTQKGSLKISQQETKVHRFDVVEYKPKGKSTVNSDLIHFSGKYCVVYLKSYNEFIVMDKKTYESAYVQMFMLEKYDKELFELVVSSPYSKIYKVKR
jgi:dolichyl-diphosphooligosaccharide--protein glycosyltransferase/undecaprenyl-diphosphooligosaccharide--protein glycosyltransferase